MPQLASFPQPATGSAPTAATRDLGAGPGASAAGAASNRVTHAAAAGASASAGSIRWTASHSSASHHTTHSHPALVNPHAFFLSSPPSSSLFPPEYARDFDQHQADGLSLVGITHSHPALARMRLAD
ncbi:unnamed protein product [Closterium sp. Naga37s-1]|nr:unnamed protein product [Closterium sp. Naga37s-1]